jgi:hypothetical protein
VPPPVGPLGCAAVSVPLAATAHPVRVLHDHNRHVLPGLHLYDTCTTAHSVIKGHVCGLQYMQGTALVALPEGWLAVWTQRVGDSPEQCSPPSHPCTPSIRPSSVRTCSCSRMLDTLMVPPAVLCRGSPNLRDANRHIAHLNLPHQLGHAKQLHVLSHSATCGADGKEL